MRAHSDKFMVRPPLGSERGGPVAEWTSAPSNGNGADVAEVMRTLDHPPAVLVGHSIGLPGRRRSRQALERTVAVILVDVSQFAPSMETALKETFAAPEDVEPRQVEAIAASIRRWCRCLGFSACRTRGYRGERKGSLQVRRGGKQAAPKHDAIVGRAACRRRELPCLLPNPAFGSVTAARRSAHAPSSVPRYPID